MPEFIDKQYITTNPQILGGEPIIAGTRVPVRAIVEEWRMESSPEGIPIGYPHLTLAQVFAALSYYCDHRDEIHGYIAANRIPEELFDPRVRT